MPPILSFLKTLWPSRASATRKLDKQFRHPAEDLITPEIRPYLENHDWRILCYPPYQQGYPAQVNGAWLMRTFQKDLYDRISVSVGMPKSDRDLYLEPVLENFAELAHLLPASQNHHHCGPAGLLRHSLEVASLALDAALTREWDNELTPARRSMRKRRWYVAAVTAGLLHDAGKPISDIRVASMDGVHNWNFSSESIFKWSQRHKLTRYFLHWRPNRHDAHVRATPTLIGIIIPLEVRAWLTDDNCDDIFSDMCDAITGYGNSPLAEIVRRADTTSTKRDLLRGPTDGGGTGVPVPRLAIDAMHRLVSDGVWEVNTPGGRVWTSTDGVYIAWQQGAQEIIEMVLKDGIIAIPRSPETLIGILVDHGIAEPPSDGEFLWHVTPHLLRKNGKGPALRCMKLKTPDTLFPASPVPPPVSISLGKEGKQTDVIAPNDAAGAAATLASQNQVDMFGPDLNGENPGDVRSAASDEAATDEPNSSTSRPAKEQKGTKKTPRQSAPVPAAPTSGVTLKPAAPAIEDAPQPRKADPVVVADAGEHYQPEAAESLEDMLLFLSASPAAVEPDPVVEAVTEAEASAVSSDAAEPAQAIPIREGKISLNELLSKGAPKKKQPAPKLEAAQTENRKAAKPKPSAFGEEVSSKLAQHEIYLLEQQPAFATKLIAASKDVDLAAQAKGKVFLCLDKGIFETADLPALVEAGWLWQDITSEGPALTRVLQLREGFLLAQDYSFMFCKLAGLNWHIPHVSLLPVDQLDNLTAAVKALMANAAIEEISGSPTLRVTLSQLNAAADQFSITSASLETALLALRDAVKIASRRKIYVRPLPVEVSTK
ncbi:MobH family relaxase [Pseudomonas sp. 2FE]|uniref:MobH family relaxase n=1 Tax=Pseudomonas sp. 2FE TaxID=2502190 RepID=UPI0014852A6F|nr:MobH family relaxase [Pseudomonas sp. 2FE]